MAACGRGSSPDRFLLRSGFTAHGGGELGWAAGRHRDRQGAIEIELLPADAPKAVENFRLLGERGYYEGVTFHRIISGFMIHAWSQKDDEGRSRHARSSRI